VLAEKVLTGKNGACRRGLKEGDTDMATVIKGTATVANNGDIFAFGKDDRGGYIIFKVKQSYCGQKRGGMDKRWVSVAENLSHFDAIETMNKKLGYVGFSHP
jgi:hypothetical protein